MLEECLSSIKNVEVPQKVRIEIVIIDQSDNQIKTQKIVNRLRKINLKRVTPLSYKYYRDDRRGISFARNCLFDKTSGEYLFTTDDDAIVSKSWIIEGVKYFKNHSKAEVVVGKVDPHTASKKMLRKIETLDSSLRWAYSIFNLGKKSFQITGDIIEYPVFLNLAVKKSFFKKIKIDTRFGNQQSIWKVYGGEDPDFIEQVKRFANIYYNPKMFVHHRLKTNKLYNKYFFWRYWSFGKERCLLEYKYNLEKSVNAKNIIKTSYEFLKYPFNFKKKINFLFALSYILTIPYFYTTSIKFRHFHSNKFISEYQR